MGCGNMQMIMKTICVLISQLSLSLIMFYKYSCNHLNIVIYTRIMSQRAVRSRRRKSEDDIVREILKLHNILMKKHKTASLVALSSKFELLQFGSENVTKKFNDRSLYWMDVFDLDDDEVINVVFFVIYI